MYGPWLGPLVVDRGWLLFFYFFFRWVTVASEGGGVGGSLGPRYMPGAREGF